MEPENSTQRRLSPIKLAIPSYVLLVVAVTPLLDKSAWSYRVSTQAFSVTQVSPKNRSHGCLY